MSSRRILILLVGALVVIPGALVAESPPEKKIANFTLTDPRDKARFSLADCKEKKAVVVIFLGTECPVNNAYMPRLVELHKEYASKGVQFLAINANKQDGADRVAEHAKKNEIPFPVVKDSGHTVADQFGAVRTPEAFLLDDKSVVRYQGRIDDQFGIGFQRPKPTRRDLAEALDEVLAGKAVSVAKTTVSGCVIGREVKAKEEGEITYSKQIARIVQKNCQECHRPKHIAPMPFMTHDDVASWSGMIKEVVKEGRMPPWHADPQYGKFSNDRSLSKEDRETLLAWIDKGCPKGDAKDLPPPRQFVEGWRIGKPDAIIEMAEEFEVPAQAPKNGVPYKYFEAETNFKEDVWVQRAEARAGSLEVVHHILAFILPAGEKFSPAGTRGRVLCGTAPGDMPLILPEGTGRKVPAGSKIVFQMHYTPNGRAQKDRSSVGLVFCKEEPKRHVIAAGIANPTLKIPAGDDNYKVESKFTFKEDGQIVNFMPHMHLRGKSFLYEAIYPDGKKEILLSVPKFDFNWQSAYRFAEPKAIPKGTVIHCIAHFDNSEKNLSNPDPTQVVKWGDQTWEEMMIGWMDFAYDVPAK